jgi:hypothetical protein
MDGDSAMHGNKSTLIGDHLAGPLRARKIGRLARPAG